ncbi:hypothetical protein ABZ863_12695 [Saccharomonospora sp. NPDC046836]|uniref:hypothetical protein n=1 Tax=Saccharomonospora sp. NPDC046836 TaxID=3156921 RepID=UPI0033CD8059
MTNWAALNHAYGSAEDLPALLDRLETEPTGELWGELWSRLCHQGSTYSASFAAFPWLAGVARGEDDSQREHAVLLAGAIVASTPDQAGPIKQRYAAEITGLQSAAEELLHHPGEGYVYRLQAYLALEGVPVWGRELDRLVHGEYEISCRVCGLGLLVTISDADGSFSENPSGERCPLRPSPPVDLRRLGRRLHELAVSVNEHALASNLQAPVRRGGMPRLWRGFTT